MKAFDIQWFKNQLNTLRVGGVWVVPRSGLIFKKTAENSLSLVNPMVLTSEQKSDFELIRDHFVAAGISVFDLTKEAQ